MICTVLDNRALKKSVKTIKKRCFSAFDVDAFRQDISDCMSNLKDFVKKSEPNTAWNKWSKLFLDICDRLAPI